MKSEEVEVTFTEGGLTIEGERKLENEAPGVRGGLVLSTESADSFCSRAQGSLAFCLLHSRSPRRAVADAAEHGSTRA